MKAHTRKDTRLLEQEYLHMYTVEDTLWWYQSLHEVVLSQLAEHCAPGGHVFDAGCGTGAMADKLVREGYRVTAVDLSPLAVEFCRRRGLSDISTGLVTAIPPRKGGYDAILLLDVLGCLPEAERLQFLAIAHRSLKPGGVLIVHAAALESLRSTHDEVSNIITRFDRPSLRTLFKSNPWEELKLSYRIFLLFPLVAAAKLLKKITSGNLSDNAKTDLQLPAPLANAALRVVQRIEDDLLNVVSFPWGSSLLAVLRKPQKDSKLVVRDQAPGKRFVAWLASSPVVRFAAHTLGFCAVAFAFLYRLSWGTLNNWDEAFYADIMREMLFRREWIIPYWNQAIFLDKPPLHIWASLPFVLVFGQNELGVRLSAAVCAIVTVCLVYWIVRKRLRLGAMAGVAAVLALLANPLFMSRVRNANTDSLLGMLFLLFFIATIAKTRWRPLWIGFLAGLVYLTKATIVVFPLLSFAIYEAASGNVFLKRAWRGYLLSATVCVVTAGAWLGAGAIRLGWKFTDFYLFRSDYGTSNVKASCISAQYLSYAYYALRFNALVIFLGGLYCAIIDRKRIQSMRYPLSEGEAVWVAICSFALLLPLTLSFSPVHYNWYLLPAMPFWAIIAGYMVHRLIKAVTWKYAAAVVFCFVLSGNLFQFERFVSPLYRENIAKDSALVGETLRKLTPRDATIVRLNHYYPSLVYYSNRRILVSTPETASTEAYFIVQGDVIKLKHPIWITGKSEDVKMYLKNLPSGKKIRLIKLENDQQIVYLP